MRDILLTLGIFSTIPFILVRPYLGVLVWSFLGYMNPHRLSWGFAYDMPFAAVIGATTIAGLLFFKEPKRIPWNGVTVVLVLFIIWMNVTTIFSLVPHDAWQQWDKVMKIQIMVFVTLMIMGTKERLNWLVWVIVISIGFYSVKNGSFAILTGGQERVWGPPGSFIEDNNALAICELMVLPLMRYLQLQATTKWARRAFTALMLLTVFAVVASYSRGALVAGLIVALFFWYKSPRKIAIAAVVALLIPVLLAFAPQKWFERMDTIETYQQDQSAMGRINAWGFAWNLALDRPLVGGGFETFDRQLFHRYAPNPDDFHDAHSNYFEVLGEQGFVGLFLYLLLGLLGWLSAGWTIRHSKGRDDLKWAQDLAAMLQVGIIAYAAGGLFLGKAYFDLYYHYLAIIVLVRVTVSKELAKDTPPLQTGNDLNTVDASPEARRRIAAASRS